MLRFLTAGESHGPCLTAIIEGLPSGLTLDLDAINHDLARRQSGYGRNYRQKIEHDQVEILSGMVYGRTIGAPLTIQIINRDWENWKDRWASGSLTKLTVPRPGHADYAGMVKYDLEDARLILERASARETAARVAVGAVARQLLKIYNIAIGSYVSDIGDIHANIPNLPYPELWALAEASEVRCPDSKAETEMKRSIDHARRTGNSLGGIFIVAATGVPVGLGSHVQWDRRLDARMAAAVISIQAVKGVEIGPAFEIARLPGSQAHDAIYPADNNRIYRLTNRAGGIEGGISNGEPIVIRAAMKPISTIAEPYNSVDLTTGHPAKPQYQRSDYCAVPSAAVIGEAVVAWTLACALVEKYGGDSIGEMTR